MVYSLLVAAASFGGGLTLDAGLYAGEEPLLTLHSTFRTPYPRTTHSTLVEQVCNYARNPCRLAGDEVFEATVPSGRASASGAWVPGTVCWNWTTHRQVGERAVRPHGRWGGPDPQVFTAQVWRAGDTRYVGVPGDKLFSSVWVDGRLVVELVCRVGRAPTGQFTHTFEVANRSPGRIGFEWAGRRGGVAVGEVYRDVVATGELTPEVDGVARLTVDGFVLVAPANVWSPSR